MRKLSHFEGKEPYLETILREIRFYIASKYIPQNSTMADFGCGFHGELLNKLSEKIKSGTGYDISVNKTPRHSNIKLYKTDINKKITRDNLKFDCITTLAVLEHVSDPDSYIKNIAIKLKPKGLLIITTPHKRSKGLLEILSLKLGLVSKDEILDHKNYFTESTLKKIIIQNKFKIMELKTFEFGLNLLCVARRY